jgi:hypothetical protein
MALFFTWGCWWFGTGAAPTLAAIQQAAARMDSTLFMQTP